MKTLHLAIIVGGMAVAMIIGVLIFESNQKNTLISMEANQTSVPPSVSSIIIPNGTEDPASGKNYEPRYLVVVLGVNNTVRWINESTIPAPYIVAASHDDSLFWNATHSANNVMLFPGKSFNFTFTKTGEFQYDTIVHAWMDGWVLVLPPSAENATETVSLNTNSGIPGPCAVFGVPCPNNPANPNNYNFTAQKFGSDIYIEEMTINGVDTYAIIKPNKTCYYPPPYGSSCTNPDDLAILRLVGVDTSIPRQYADITLSGLKPQYMQGEPVSFELKISGYGYDACEIPYVSVLGYNGTVWQSTKNPWFSCIPGRGQHNTVIGMNTLGGPFSINRTGTYAVHVDYAANSTEAKFNVVPKTVMISSNETKTSTNYESSKESIRIIPEYPIATGINKNGTITDSETIEILFDNYRQTGATLVIQILNPHGGTYGVDNIPANDIQPDGFYKYQIYIKGNESDMGQYKVIVTHGNATASTTTYLSNVIP